MIVLTVLLTGGVQLQAAVGTWRSHTSMSEVRDIARIGNAYWAASGGGLFEWIEGTTEYRRYTNSDGLLGNDLTAVGVDAAGKVWSGTSGGVIHVLSPSDGRWDYVLDIAQSDRTSKRIHRLVMDGDTVLICTDFGLSLFDASEFLFGDTYTQFGSLTNVRVAVTDAVIFDDSIWVTVSDGSAVHRVAVSSLANPNRLPPESWTLSAMGIPGTRPVVLEPFGDRLFAGASTGLFYRASGVWTEVLPLAGKNIIGAHATDDALVVITPGEVFSLDANLNISNFPLLPSEGTSVSVDTTGEPVVGSKGLGIMTLNTEWESHIPNGPASNQFLSLAVDAAGNIWAASGIVGGNGFFRFNGSEWRSFTRENSGLPTNEFYRVSPSCTGGIWASSWGWGVVEMPPGADAVDTSLIFNMNVGLEGLPPDGSYIVVSDVVCDQSGNEWMSINSSRTGEIIAVRHPDRSIWTTNALNIGAARISTLWYNVPLDRMFAVDAFGNLWGGSRHVTYRGVFSLGNRGEIADSITTFVTEQDGLPSSDITTILVDRDNDIWVGTERGIGIILDPADPLRPGGIAAYKPLNGIVINTIAVDALNQKWVGTPDGVVVLSPDGVQQIASYTRENTGGKLIDNDVKSIAFDGTSGTVYFGTLSGLSSLTTSAAAPKPEFDKLVISPNPYLLPASGPALIDGLVENSAIKILSVDGKLVREIISPGGRVGFWDGTDDDGSPVASGIYIIVAYSADGNQLAKGKIAVVRK
jgi:sugar lactone lactonase YvrE